MELKELIKESTIKLDLISMDKDSVIEEMIDVLVKDGVVKNRKKFKRDILERESLSNTGIGFGIAIPHAKSKAVIKPRIAVGITRTGIDYGSIDGKDIKIIFMIAVNDKQEDLHLKALANVARKLMHEEFRERLLSAKTEKEIIEMI